MKQTALFWTCTAALVFPGLLLAARDPFWPIGYQPGSEEAVAQPVDPRPAPKGRVLTDEELRELARKEAERIRQSLVRKGTMIAGDNIYAYVQNQWLTVGDVLTVEVEGRNYRLEIKDLTTDNIELEAHRAQAPLQLTPRKQP